MIKIRQLWSKLSTHVYTTLPERIHGTSLKPGTSIEELRKELEDWKSFIPRANDRSPSNPLSVFASHQWFQLAYNHTILLLYRQYLVVGDDGSSQTQDLGIVNRAFEECYARAREMCIIYRWLYQKPTIQFTWGSLHMLFLAGLTYLYCLWRSDSVRQAVRQSDIVDTCMACQTVLVIIAERWQVATSYRDLFEALSKRTIKMICDDKVAPRPTASTRQSYNPYSASNPAHATFPDWLQGIAVPPESDWLVQEFFKGMQELESGPMYNSWNGDSEFEFLSGAFDSTCTWP